MRRAIIRSLEKFGRLKLTCTSRIQLHQMHGLVFGASLVRRLASRLQGTAERAAASRQRYVA